MEVQKMTIAEQKILVPPFAKIMASEEDMDKNQQHFFMRWIENWNKGKALAIDGYISYLFCYVYKVLALPPEDVSQQLIRLKKAYPLERKFHEYCDAWLSDSYVLQGQYKKALCAFPSIDINSRSATCTEHLLSIKLMTGDHLTGLDLLTLNGPKVTKWGKEHLSQVAHFLDIILNVLEKHKGCNLLNYWKTTTTSCPYSVYRGTPRSSSADISVYLFSQNKEIIKFIREKTREAENTVREEMKIPLVGEGWIGETELYYAISDALTDTQVIQHARPEWLGRQHLDVFIPEYAVAIEYQGAQHDKPIEYFGGEEAFLATKKRDAAKKLKCLKNNVKLIEVRPGYNLSELIRMVREYSAYVLDNQ